MAVPVTYVPAALHWSQWCRNFHSSQLHTLLHESRDPSKHTSVCSAIIQVLCTQYLYAAICCVLCVAMCAYVEHMCEKGGDKILIINKAKQIHLDDSVLDFAIGSPLMFIILPLPLKLWRSHDRTNVLTICTYAWLTVVAMCRLVLMISSISNTPPFGRGGISSLHTNTTI